MCDIHRSYLTLMMRVREMGCMVVRSYTHQTTATPALMETLSLGRQVCATSPPPPSSSSFSIFSPSLLLLLLLLLFKAVFSIIPVCCIVCVKGQSSEVARGHERVESGKEGVRELKDKTPVAGEKQENSHLPSDNVRLKKNCQKSYSLDHVIFIARSKYCR